MSRPGAGLLPRACRSQRRLASSPDERSNIRDITPGCACGYGGRRAQPSIGYAQGRTRIALRSSGLRLTGSLAVEVADRQPVGPRSVDVKLQLGLQSLCQFFAAGCRVGKMDKVLARDVADVANIAHLNKQRLFRVST
jgi:hypothetical protein